MTHFLPTTLILAGAMVTGGCATKKYVRTTTAPIQARVDQVGEQATKQGQMIEDTRGEVKKVDENAQSGISAAKERAMTAENKAGEAMTKANQVGEVAQKNTQDINNLRDNLRQVVSNLDDYKLQTEATVPFKFNKYVLDDHARQELDKLAADAGKLKRYFIAVEGFTDTTGTKEYNDVLSRRRADAVVQYLVTQHNIPLYRIHMIGLGEQKLADQGRNRAARAKNRRVEIKVFSADQGVTLSQLQ